VFIFAFTTYSNGLKDIAKHMDYPWRHADVDALESIVLDFQYVKALDKSKDKIQEVMDYN